MVSFMEISDGLIRKATTYFARTFDRPEWRTQWTERIPDEAPDR
jgi:hypothetical protein